MFKVSVKDKWLKSLSVIDLDVTAYVDSDKSTVHGASGSSVLKGPARHEYEGWDQNGQFIKKLGFPAGERGSVQFSLRVDYQGFEKPRGWSRKASGSVFVPGVFLPFRCTPEGDFKLLRSGRTSADYPDRPLTVDVAVYQVKKHPADTRPALVPAPVWDGWMKQMNLLRLVVVADLSVNENGPGRLSVTIHPDSVAPPANVAAGPTGPNTAVLGPFVIDLEPIDAPGPTDLAPPVTSEGGVLWNVYFPIDSADIDKVVNERGLGGPKPQGSAFDDWLKRDALPRWDVTAALVEEKASLHAEARASATGNGMTPAQRALYNQKLSEQRLASVVKRAKKALREGLGFTVELDPGQLEAVGDKKAPKPGEEDVVERRCQVWFAGDDLKKAVKELYGRKFRGWRALSPFNP